ncbi:kinase-like domain-containing protein [Daldinia caldariorum]|uniref:kinase-like domain-containing protein n=1 Tax=Daldinia caldariorum TaxID=326644 RepID=UPI0020079148|nr:kinase-like domain-containing protein [Daldinia caldariorum]KAI1470690.1 kinase-like domain-containing protein [Daldinia caldariorum]
MSETTSVRLSADEEEVAGNGLILERSPFGLEKIYDYEQGGHHPVHLGDVLHSRYKIIHKLGSGGYSNVWLCRDISSDGDSDSDTLKHKYVALKIIMGEGSTKDCPELRINRLLESGFENLETADYFCLPLDQFEIQGPNGTHLVFVYPVLGPRVSRLLSLVESEDPGAPLRKICLQMTQAMADLHRRGICHGDFRPANILAHISGLDGLSEGEVLAILGKPDTAKVVTYSGDDHDLPSAPRYLVYPVDWNAVTKNTALLHLISGKACIVDFGESYDITSPVTELGIPQIYCSPEYALEGKVGIGCDLWALGCTLFEIRTGRKLFDTFDDDVDGHLCKVAKVLGKFPEPWWSETWEQRKHYFENEVDADGRVVPVYVGSNDKSPGPGVIGALVSQKPEPRSLQESLAEGLFYENSHGPGGIQRDISQEEIEVFSDLLLKLLRYTPEDRPPASALVEHGWFMY